MPNPDLEFDPSRLMGLAKKAREAKAVARAENDRIADLRERRTDVQRRAGLAKMRAADGDPRSRTAYAEQSAALETEAAAIAAQMRDADAEAGELSAATNSHARAFAKALNFAVEANLDIPAELSEQAARVRNGGRPTFELDAAWGGRQ